MNHQIKHLPDEIDFGETIKGVTESVVFFERYKTVRILGRGGMGVVWLARDLVRNMDVAMKFLPEMVAIDDVSFDDLRKETCVGMQMSHGNLVRMLDLEADKVARTAAIIMEYIDGPTLATLRLQQPNQVFETKVLEPWVLQMVDALQYAHDLAKMIHRDLKPSNLMVTQDNKLKVADFGIASSVRDSVSRVSVRANSGAGTLMYMSPQQLMGEVPTRAFDIYSFGATLYELLTGRPPFYAGDVAKQIETKIPPLLAERRAEFGVEGEKIPAAWEDTIAACLEKDPRDRPASMAEIAKALRGEKFNRGSGETKSSAARRRTAAASGGAGKTASVTTTTWAAAAVITLALGGAGWYFGVQQPRQQAALEQARLKREEEERAAAEQRKAMAQLGELQMKKSSMERRAELASSAKERLEQWQKFGTELLALDIPRISEDDQMREEVRLMVKNLASDVAREEAQYATALQELKQAMTQLRTEGDRPDLGAGPKRERWKNLLEEWPTSRFNEVYGSEHLPLLAAAREQEADWTKAADVETPAQPVGFPQCYDGSPIASWDDVEKKAALAMIQNVLKSASLWQRDPDLKYDGDLHAAIVAYQRQKDLPATGKLDQYTLQRMGVPTDKRPTAMLASATGGGGKSRSNGGGGNAAAASGGGADWTKWLQLAGAVGAAKGGGVRPPGPAAPMGGAPMPFVPRFPFGR